MSLQLAAHCFRCVVRLGWSDGRGGASCDCACGRVSRHLLESRRDDVRRALHGAAAARIQSVTCRHVAAELVILRAVAHLRLVLRVLRELLRVHFVHVQSAVQRHMPRRRSACAHAALSSSRRIQSVGHAWQSAAEQWRHSHGSDGKHAAIADASAGGKRVPAFSDRVRFFSRSGAGSAHQRIPRSTTALLSLQSVDLQHAMCAALHCGCAALLISLFVLCCLCSGRSVSSTRLPSPRIRQLQPKPNVHGKRTLSSNSTSFLMPSMRSSDVHMRSARELLQSMPRCALATVTSIAQADTSGIA